MRTIIFSLVLFAGFCCIACNNEKVYPKAEDALDAGREFIDGCLKGDFAKAAYYMIPDERNKNLLDTQQINYEKEPKSVKEEYNAASIIINEDAVLNDSTHIINYQNSYDKTGRKVKVILRNNSWQVDFKYTFDGNL
jgi:hypothetical protein